MALARVRIKIVDLNTMLGITAKLDAIFVDHPGQDWHAVTGPNGIFDAGLTPGDYVITVSSSGYVTVNWNVHIELDGEITQGLVPISIGQDAIQVHGREFLVNGQRRKIAMATDFLLVQKKALGLDIKPIIKQRRSAGAEFLRVLTMAKNIADFNPHTYDVKGVLGATLDDIHSEGMRAQVEGFADVQLIGLTVEEQRQHQDICCEVIRSRGALDLYDLGNEIDKNGIDANNFSKPTGVISSKGSLQNNKPPHAPYWDYGTFHPRRDGTDYYFSKFLSDITPQSEIYVGVEGEPPANIPVVADEPIGFQATNDPGRRSNYPGFAYRIGSIYCMYINGVDYHSTHGVISELWDEVEWKCALAFFDGFRDGKKGW